MKKIFTFLIGIVLSITILNSQVAPPQAFSFKANIKDKYGLPVLFKKINLRMTILEGGINGTVVYSEYFTPTTDLYSQVDVQIGRGTVLPGYGIFHSIDWSSDEYFLKIEVDAKGGTNYQLLSVTQLLSVPYALYAGKAGNAFSGNYSEIIGAPTKLSLFDNDIPFLTIETDPIFNFSPAYRITDKQITNWDAVFLWGNHNLAGYATTSGIENLKNKTLTAPIINSPAGLVKADVGLGEVDNTSDLLKPISSATQAALELKESILTFKNPLNREANNISLPPATNISNGYLSIADKTKLDGLNNADGSETILTAGENITVSGTGTNESPYTVNAPGVITGAITLLRVLSGGNDAGGNIISNLANPLTGNDAATKVYVDALETRIAILEAQVASLMGQEIDLDHDGFNPPQDCNDSDDTIHPGAQEVQGDEKDNDCDGQVDENAQYFEIGTFPYTHNGEFTYFPQEFSFGLPNITQVGMVTVDLENQIELGRYGTYAYANETLIASSVTSHDISFVVEAGVDYEIILKNIESNTGDNLGTFTITITFDLTDIDGDNYTLAQGDCDDNNPNIHPGATEIPGNDIDEDCNGFVSCFRDGDNDGYGSTSIAIDCYPATDGISLGAGVCGSGNNDGLDETASDCADNDPRINPEATEICDGKDNDCDGQVDENIDAPLGNKSNVGVCIGLHKICNGSVGWIEPDYSTILNYQDIETICDGLDNDCDGKVDEDCPSTTCTNDGDCGVGYYCDKNNCVAKKQNGSACTNDAQCLSGYCVDGFCSPGPAVDSDGDGYTVAAGDCDDSNPTMHPVASEICGDGIDQDCNGSDLSCDPNANWQPGYSWIDPQDGSTYKTVLIGTQAWMAEELGATKLNDGTEIPYIPDDIVWSGLTTPGYCWKVGLDEPSHILFYNWYTINTGKLCPSGFHIPSENDWQTLLTYIQDEVGAPEDVAASLRTNNHPLKWVCDATEHLDTYGFEAVPSGFRLNDGSYNYGHFFARYWSTTPSRWDITNNLATFEIDCSYAIIGDSPKNFGNPVRCIKD